MHLLEPNIKEYIESLREIGYSTDLAMADIIDNSVTAIPTFIKIQTLVSSELQVAIFDDGIGMTRNELMEAMRMSSKGPNAFRGESDLGRFGLGLKTASFSQCKKLIVISKKNDELNGFCWDLELIAIKGWYLLDANFENIPYLDELKNLNSGTIVLWENIDKFNSEILADKIDSLRYYLGLVFHRFIEGTANASKINISINGNNIKPQNPFADSNNEFGSVQELESYDLKFNKEKIKIRPYIMPHHSKLSDSDYNKIGMKEGYYNSQGFYLYRINRLIEYGTWWGLKPSNESNKLVRIKVDIPNSMDIDWSIDIKKSTATPPYAIKTQLKRILEYVLPIGSRVYTRRKAKSKNSDTIKIWESKINSANGKISFKINREHPLLVQMYSTLDESLKLQLEFFLIGIEQFLPLELIHAELFQAPKNIDQNINFDHEKFRKLIENSNFSEEEMRKLLLTESFEEKL